MYLQWTRVSFILIRFDKLPAMILVQIFPFVIFHFSSVLFVSRTFNLQNHWEKSLRGQNTHNELIKLPETRTMSIHIKLLLLRTSFFTNLHMYNVIHLRTTGKRYDEPYLFFFFIHESNFKIQ